VHSSQLGVRFRQAFEGGAAGLLAAPANVPIETSTAPPHSKARSASEAVLPFADRVTEAMCQVRTHAAQQSQHTGGALAIPTAL
jgi:hypothetical protein